MARLVWDQVGTRFYETGVDRGVLYLPGNTPGVVWDGLVAVSEGSEGGTVNPYHRDGMKYIDHVENEDFQGLLEAVSAPEEFTICEGNLKLAPGLYATRQSRVRFGLSYRTMVASDTEETAGHKIHVIWNATAAPGSRNYRTTSNNPDPETRQWGITAVPPIPTGPGYKPVAHFVLDTRYIAPSKLTQVEDILYGTSMADSRIPTQAELITILGT